MTEGKATVDPNYEVWLAALESGEYKQAQSMLFDGEGYCCLGVGDREVFGAQFIYDDGILGWVDDMDCQGTLDKDRAKVLRLDEKITHEDVQLSFDVTGLAVIAPNDAGCCSRQSMLTALNDEGATFEQIAEFIRRAGWHLE